MAKSRPPETSSHSETSPPEQLGVREARRLGWVLRETGLLPDGESAGELAPGQVGSLGGGGDAVTYLVRRPGGDVVVKFNDRWLEAEAAALRAWREHTSRVPEVLGAGTVPSSGARAVKYLVLGALVNDEGGVVETADGYLDRSPWAARGVGRALGEELQTLHRARCTAGFGNFADSPGAGRRYDSWGAYLADFLGQHADYVAGLGVPHHRVEAACAVVRRCRYLDEPRYLHGDVSIRNVAILGEDPVRVSLFDPNPLCGDPSWDIAPLANNAELSERRHRADGAAAGSLHRDREVLGGFWESYPAPVAEEPLLTARLVQAVLQAEHRDETADDAEVDDTDVEIAHELIRDTIDRMST